MSGKVAASAFAASVFIVFLLWATKSLGVIGLLGAFSVGLISYSMDASIEMAVASIIVAGVAIKYVLPLVQVKWGEAAAAKEAFESGSGTGAASAGATRGVGRVIGRIGDMKAGKKEIEGFADAAVAYASDPNAPPGAGGQATGAVTTTGMQESAQITTGGGGGPSSMVGTNTPPASSNITSLPSVTSPGMLTVPIPNIGASGATMVSTTTTGGAQTSTGAVMGTMSNSAAIGAIAAAPPQGSPLIGSGMQEAQVPGRGNSIAAAAGPPLLSTLPALPGAIQPGATQPGAIQQLQPGAIQQLQQTQQPQQLQQGAIQPTQQLQQTQQIQPGTIATALTPAAGAQGFANVERFQAQEEEGLFKLGQIPTEAKNGPHIDAGTTIMRALSSLNPNQINSLTEDTKKLLDTQKSLMGMLSTMKPILSDGKNMLDSFTTMFGK